MNRGSDVLTTLMWGLRRYAWVVVLFVAGIGVLVPAIQSRAPAEYEARAQVGPIQPVIFSNLNPLPKLGDSAFTNGSVADAVRQALGVSASKDVIPGTVRLTTAQDNPVMEVIGRATKQETAVTVTDTAADQLVLELNKYAGSVSTFAVTHKAVVSATPTAKIAGGYLSIAIGLVAGLVAGIGAVALLLVLRRPVVDSAAAEDATGVPVLGRVRLPRTGSELDASDLMGIGLLCRRILTAGHKVVYVAGPARAQVEQLSASMTEFMERVQSTATDSAATNGAARDDVTSPAAPRTAEIVVLSGPSLEQWARVPDDSSMTLLAVPEGITTRTLRNLADEHFTGTPAGVVLVAQHRPHRGDGPAKRGPEPRKSASKPGKQQGKQQPGKAPAR